MGENHDDVIDAKIDLSTVYRRIGKVEKAENLCVSALTVIRDQNRSTEDPRMLKCMNELAKIFLSRDKIAQAESMSRNVFERSRLSLGEKSSVSLIRGQVLVEALRKGVNFDEAEKLSKSLVESMEQILGQYSPRYPRCDGCTCRNRCFTKRSSGDLTSMNKFLTQKKECLGTTSGNIIHSQGHCSYSKITGFTRRSGRNSIHCLHSFKNKNGLEHPETLRAMNELADLYLDSGKQVDAFQLSNETLIIELRIMGELDPMTLQTRYRIGKLHYLAERKEEAMEELGDV